MRIALASDRAGFAEKEKLKTLLQDLGVELRTWAQSLLFSVSSW